MVDITVDNGDLHDYAVRSSETVTNKLIQHVRLDVGSGSTESVVVQDLPVSTKRDLAPSSPTFATIGATTTAAVAVNADRKGLILTNTSANTISIAFGVAAVLNSGITLPQNGVFKMDEYSFCTEAVNAIASSGSSNLAIQEFE